MRGGATRSVPAALAGPAAPRSATNISRSRRFSLPLRACSLASELTPGLFKRGGLCLMGKFPPFKASESLHYTTTLPHNTMFSS